MSDDAGRPCVRVLVRAQMQALRQSPPQLNWDDYFSNRPKKIRKKKKKDRKENLKSTSDRGQRR